MKSLYPAERHSSHSEDLLEDYRQEKALRVDVKAYQARHDAVENPIIIRVSA